MGWLSIYLKTVIQSTRVKLEHPFLIIGYVEVFGASFKMYAWGLCGFEWEMTVWTLCAMVIAIRMRDNRAK